MKAHNNLYVVIITLFVITKSVYGVEENVYYDENYIFSEHLGDERLTFDDIKVGDKIYFNNIIIMPRVGESGFLSIEFDRAELSSTFIDDIFYNKKDNITELHPLLQSGIELVLSKGKLVINMYSGVALHFRNDIYSDASYRTFRANDVAGKVINVSGNVLISRDVKIIKNKLSNFYISLRHGKRFDDKGRLIIIKPEQFVPRISNDE